jgi:hypothetical protein
MQQIATEQRIDEFEHGFESSQSGSVCFAGSSRMLGEVVRWPIMVEPSGRPAV